MSQQVQLAERGATGAIPGKTFKNVIWVDVEDYFHAESFADIVQRSEWDNYQTRVVDNTKRLLLPFAELDVEATFFILGWVTERFPGLGRDIAAAGHELACHSYWHRLIYKLDPKDFREDTYRAKATIEQIAGVPVYGYRAPTYSVTVKPLWALDILAELGFTFDSSIFPVHHERYGIPKSVLAITLLSGIGFGAGRILCAGYSRRTPSGALETATAAVLFLHD